MRITDNPFEVAGKATKKNPILLVISNLGAGGTPNLVVNSNRTEATKLNGLRIGPGASSPQITATGPYYIVSGTAGTPQEADIRQDNL